MTVRPVAAHHAVLAWIAGGLSAFRSLSAVEMYEVKGKEIFKEVKIQN